MNNNEWPVHGRITGPLVMIGFGSIGKGMLHLLERHFEFDRSRFVVIDPNDADRALLDANGIRFVHAAVTRDGYRDLLTPLLTEGGGQGFCVNVSVDVSSRAVMELCREVGALYIDTVAEPWAGFYLDESAGPEARTNYALREIILEAQAENPGGPTAVNCCGANPGLVSWLVKQALLNLATDTGIEAPEPKTRDEWAALMQRVGVKGIHIAERDTQRSLSAALVVSVVLPSPKPSIPRGIYDRTTRGFRIYLATPRLRGLLAINMAVAAAGALVIVNTVVYVQATFGLGQSDTALALAAFGGGSMLVALVLPRLLNTIPDRTAMLAGASALAVATLIAAVIPSYGWLLPLWFLIGAGYSMAQTPSGRLLRRSSHAEDRPALFAAQFALSHACWLFTYPLAGWTGASFGLPATSVTLALIAGSAVATAAWLWPAGDPEMVEHSHDGLPASHPHWNEGVADGRNRHAHAYVIDDLHSAWPHAG